MRINQFCRLISHPPVLFPHKASLVRLLNGNFKTDCERLIVILCQNAQNSVEPVNIFCAGVR
jgi:hypothetical protein